MKIYTDKFQYIVFGKNQKLETITMNNITISPDDNVKLLWLILLCSDNRLSFDEHVSIACMKAGKQLQNEKTKLILYNSFMQC